MEELILKYATHLSVLKISLQEDAAQIAQEHLVLWVMGPLSEK